MNVWPGLKTSLRALYALSPSHHPHIGTATCFGGPHVSVEWRGKQSILTLLYDTHGLWSYAGCLFDTSLMIRPSLSLKGHFHLTDSGQIPESEQQILRVFLSMMYVESAEILVHFPTSLLYLSREAQKK